MYAFWTPFPPARSGTADYAAALVRLLTPRHEVVVVVADDAFDAHTSAAAAAAGARAIPAGRYGEIAGEVALDVYFVANNPHHLYLLRQAERHPGLVVLHEASVDWAYWLLAGAETAARPEARAAAFEAELRAALPLHPRALGPHKLAIASYVASMLDPLLSPALGVIVHNPVLATRLSFEGARGVAFVPHPPLPPLPREAVADGWEALAPQLPDRPVLFGSLGFASPYKRLPVVVEAYARFAHEHPREARRTALIVAGQSDEQTARALAAARERHDVAPGKWVTLPYLGEAELQALVRRLDLVVNLRYPSCGEASGMLTRGLEAGKPMLVSDHAYAGSLPDDVVVKIPVGAGEVDALTSAFARRASGDLLVDPARVRRFAETVFAPAAVADRFGKHLERFRERKTLAV